MKENVNNSGWIIGATTLLGVGVGSIFLQQSALYFVASIISGIAVGLVISAVVFKES